MLCVAEGYGPRAGRRDVAFLTKHSARATRMRMELHTMEHHARARAAVTTYCTGWGGSRCPRSSPSSQLRPQRPKNPPPLLASFSSCAAIIFSRAISRGDLPPFFFFAAIAARFAAFCSAIAAYALFPPPLGPAAAGSRYTLNLFFPTLHVGHL
eukprot:31139-Pelagococcus_subviridis.AAC.13